MHTFASGMNLLTDAEHAISSCVNGSFISSATPIPPDPAIASVILEFFIDCLTSLKISQTAERTSEKCLQYLL